VEEKPSQQIIRARIKANIWLLPGDMGVQDRISLVVPQVNGKIALQRTQLPEHLV
jgi:hypothetical protein